MSRMGGVAIVLFSDLVDSTALLAALGDDRMEEVRRAHVSDVTSAVEAAGGRLVKTLGDGAMASFESALGALRAAAGIQAAVERLDADHGGIGIAARVGIAAGEPIADGDDLHGMAVVIASRLSSAAGTGEVLVQDVVGTLVASRDGVALEEASDYELKGVPSRVPAARLRWRELVAEEPGESAGDAAAGGSAGTPAAAAPRLPPALAAYSEEPLIGRDREIDALREATAPRPGRRAVLVLGEPGIGKTRHAAAAAAEAHARGATVVLARCPPEAVVPFEPWVRAIGELALAGDDAWRAKLAAAAGSELVALVPQLDHQAAGAERAMSGELVAAEGARYRLLHGIGAALVCAAGDAPLHIVLDDAHWCDPASAQALEHLLDGAPATQLVLVVTARDRELGRRHPVSRALGDLRRTGDLDELRLGGLDASGLAALVGARVGRAITPRLAERLQARTAGNPFFAGELVRDLDEQGALRDDDGLEAAPVPDAVTDLVEERLARLDPDTERLLCAVAAIGPSAPVALAARAVGLGPEEGERAVREALAERLVDDVVAAEPTIAFPHALVREALIAGTGEADRARLHLAIARALEGEPDVEPADLARHHGLSIELSGPAPAIAAYRAAAAAAAEGHDHERAAAHLRSVLALLPEADLAARAPALLELGEQELLAADLFRAREAFRGAADAARATGDSGTLARAGLGFAGGDISFGIETNYYDALAVELLREGLDALGDREPRLALRMGFRLCFALVFTDDAAALAALVARAKALDRQLDDAESHVLARSTEVLAMVGRSSDPIAVLDRAVGEFIELGELAAKCSREDLQFRIALWSTFSLYSLGRVAECEAAIERVAEIAQRLGSPRFAWEVDYIRAQRLLDRGDRAGAEVLVHRAGSTLRRLRPDLQMSAELLLRVAAGAIYDDETVTSRAVFEATEALAPWGMMSALATFGAARDGDHETVRRRLASLLTGDLSALRRPDGHLPAALCWLAFAATLAGDREAGARLRPLLEPLRPYVISITPLVYMGQLPEWHIGRLELLAGDSEAAIGELRPAVAKADAMDLVFPAGNARVDLAIALHRRDDPGDSEEARAVLAEGEAIAARHGMGSVESQAVLAHAELDGREPAAPSPAPERARPIRALAARGGRRALAAMAGGLDDAELERRFADPRRQRALVKAMARGFQPAHSGGFDGAIAYELEPFAIEPPPDAPWRWAIEVDSRAGRARLLEPAPLDAAATIHIGLADWVRVVAGLQDPLTVMVAGRCSVEGDVVLVARLEAMFGGRTAVEL
jgi:eukaryotic-like serine/threonine-protein kinase